MTRAVATFTVTVNNKRVRVRLLPTVLDVHHACVEGTRWRSDKTVYAFFNPSVGASHIGTIVLPLDEISPELITHEASHAAHHVERLRMEMRTAVIVDDAAEERIATFTGRLSERIARRCCALHKRGRI
jgi:hypothetical protein